MEEVDGIAPECAACPIPKLSDTGARVMEIRGLLISLAEIVDPATVISICGGMSKAELQLMAALETEIQKEKSKE